MVRDVGTNQLCPSFEMAATPISSSYTIETHGRFLSLAWLGDVLAGMWFSLPPGSWGLSTMPQAWYTPSSLLRVWWKTPHRSPREPLEVDDAFLRGRLQTREHHWVIDRKDDGTTGLLDDEATRKGEPAKTPVKRQ
jgi:hypothetical protein